MMYQSAVVVVMMVAVGVGANILPQQTRATCEDITITPNTKATIESPNYPSNYGDNYRCQQEITCTTESETYLEFVCADFVVENSASCTNDKLIIKYRDVDMKTHCGTDSPAGTTTTTGWVRLTFSSNGNLNNKGYRCNVWCRSKTTTAAPTTVAATTVAPTTAAPTTAAPTTAAPTTVAPTTAAPTTAAPTTAAPTTAAPTTAAPTTAAPTTAAPTTAAPSTPLC